LCHVCHRALPLLDQVPPTRGRLEPQVSRYHTPGLLRPRRTSRF